ncbi:uncharacterized protein LOC101846403 isoform X2 [Aplysia californica]|uniref:Uncharacterized protein LOC101846403 isoform X2 n=1 Tax=Aplysia californica TaxID=6500 RepID=A0ABM0JDG0_APLCA|nr:uncharacterized protein LOC101846403 isoform X2 [Aplysia californica]
MGLNPEFSQLCDLMQHLDKQLAKTLSSKEVNSPNKSWCRSDNNSSMLESAVKQDRKYPGNSCLPGERKDKSEPSWASLLSSPGTNALKRGPSQESLCSNTPVSGKPTLSSINFRLRRHRSNPSLSDIKTEYPRAGMGGVSPHPSRSESRYHSPSFKVNLGEDNHCQGDYSRLHRSTARDNSCRRSVDPLSGMFLFGSAGSDVERTLRKGRRQQLSNSCVAASVPSSFNAFQQRAQKIDKTINELLEGHHSWQSTSSISVSSASAGGTPKRRNSWAEMLDQSQNNEVSPLQKEEVRKHGSPVDPVLHSRMPSLRYTSSTALSGLTSNTNRSSFLPGTRSSPSLANFSPHAMMSVPISQTSTTSMDSLKKAISRSRSILGDNNLARSQSYLFGKVLGLHKGSYVPPASVSNAEIRPNTLRLAADKNTASADKNPGLDGSLYSSLSKEKKRLQNIDNIINQTPMHGHNSRTAWKLPAWLMDSETYRYSRLNQRRATSTGDMLTLGRSFTSISSTPDSSSQLLYSSHRSIGRGLAPNSSTPSLRNRDWWPSDMNASSSRNWNNACGRGGSWESNAPWRHGDWDHNNAPYSSSSSHNASPSQRDKSQPPFWRDCGSDVGGGGRAGGGGRGRGGYFDRNNKFPTRQNSPTTATGSCSQSSYSLTGDKFGNCEHYHSNDKSPPLSRSFTCANTAAGGCGGSGCGGGLQHQLRRQQSETVASKRNRGGGGGGSENSKKESGGGRRTRPAVLAHRLSSTAPGHGRGVHHNKVTGVNAGYHRVPLVRAAWCPAGSTTATRHKDAKWVWKIAGSKNERQRKKIPVKYTPYEPKITPERQQQNHEKTERENGQEMINGSNNKDCEVDHAHHNRHQPSPDSIRSPRPSDTASSLPSPLEGRHTSGAPVCAPSVRWRNNGRSSLLGGVFSTPLLQRCASLRPGGPDKFGARTSTSSRAASRGLNVNINNGNKGKKSKGNKGRKKDSAIKSRSSGENRVETTQSCRI